MLANMITLTPGTMSLDVSDDRKVLYVHGMHVYELEAFRDGIKEGFEKKVREAFA
jgi:multicomponent Na+:H+ antiporter subunit E